MRQHSNWEQECAYIDRGISPIAGLDEVGRGAWAGPLVAAAYVFTSIPTDILLYDSKQLIARKRADLVRQLVTLGNAGIGEVTPEEIDTLGLQAAQYLAYERAILNLPHMPKMILLDGRPWHACPWEHQAIISGDRLVASIAAASIIAKEYRDTVMQTVAHRAYPLYRFDTHVGYGTALHRSALARWGVQPIHRRSYKPIQAFLSP